LKAKVGGQTLDVRPTDPADLDDVARIVASAVGTAPTRGVEDPGLLSVPVDDAQALPTVVARLQADGIQITELALRLASLDEVFLALTGHTAEDGASASNTAANNAAGNNAAGNNAAGNNAAERRPAFDVPTPRATTSTGANR
jgi:hypothetical protein